MHPPSHLHSDVHLTPALQHLQFPLYIFVHHMCIRMAHALLAPARVVQNGKHISLWSSLYQSQVTCFQIKLVWNTDILTCSKSAAWVGGMFFNERLPMKNKSYLASLMFRWRGTCLAVCTLSRVKHFGSLVRSINVSVRSILRCIPATLVAKAQNVGGCITTC